jgi:hypothetical protein
MTLSNQNCIHKENKGRLKLELRELLATVQFSVMFSCLLSKNITIKMCRGIILPMFSVGVKPGLSCSGKNIE